MTVGQILENAAAMLQITTTDMVVGNQHLGIRAMNSARKKVEQIRDFVYQDTMVRLSVGVSGANLSAAVLESDGTTAANVKAIQTAYLRDATTTPATYYPLYFDNQKTIAQRAREISDRWSYDGEWDGMRYRDDNELLLGTDRLQVYQNGRTLYFNPQQTETRVLALQASLWMTDYDYNYVYVNASSTASTAVTLAVGTTIPANFIAGVTFLGRTVTGIIGTAVTLSGNANVTITTTTRVTFINEPYSTLSAAEQVREAYTDWFIEAAHEFLLWSVVVDLNYRFKTFVPRQDGNLSPPEKLRDQAMEAVLLWDDWSMQGAAIPQGIR